MNDEKMATSMENQTDAGGCDPLPSANEAEDPASLTDDVTAPHTGADNRTNDSGTGVTNDTDDTAADSASTREDRLPDSDLLSVGDPLQDSASDSDAAFALSAQEQLGLLQHELNQLREERENAKKARESFRRMTDELREFHTLFPEVSLSQIPDEVFDGMYDGIPPAASYALYLKREREKQKEAERINNANRQRSSGSLVAADADYFSPDEVRAMSQDDVRKNYQKIMQSIQKWR